MKKIIFFFILIVILIFIFDKVLMPWIVKNEEIKLPSVVGMPYEQAMLVLQNTGVEPVKGGERYDSKYPQGTVIFQRPSGDKIVKKGSRVYLIISSGNVKIKVPNLSYKSIEEAQLILSRYGLKIGEIYEYSLSDGPIGTIVSQSINPGVEVDKGTEIDLYVRTQPSYKRIEVPNLKGLSFSEAKNIIMKLGLELGNVIYQPSLNLLPNTVVYQEPEPSSLVDPGTRINLVVIKEKVEKEDIIE